MREVNFLGDLSQHFNKFDWLSCVVCLLLFPQLHMGNILIRWVWQVSSLSLTLNAYSNVSTAQSNIVCHLTPVNARVVLLQGPHKNQRVIQHLCSIWHFSIQPTTYKTCQIASKQQDLSSAQTLWKMSVAVLIYRVNQKLDLRFKCLWLKKAFFCEMDELDQIRKQPTMPSIHGNSFKMHS